MSGANLFRVQRQAQIAERWVVVDHMGNIAGIYSSQEQAEHHARAMNEYAQRVQRVTTEVP